jgi:predicted helicase
LGGLGLKRQDMGIDLICERNGRYTAVQCKYKKPSGTKSKTIVTWSQLSTFYALVLRTGGSSHDRSSQAYSAVAGPAPRSPSRQIYSDAPCGDQC